MRFPPGLIEEAIASAPARFTLHARNPENDTEIGGDTIVFGTVASPPNASDADRGRRPGNHDDYRNFLRLAQYFNAIGFISGYPVEPIDLHASVRHLEALRDMAVLTDKPMHAYSLGRERICDAIEIARIARGVSGSELEAQPSLFSIVNTNSPLKLDVPMLGGIMEMSSRNQVICITPFTLAGAMAPVTVAGALVEQNAEALAGIAFTQMVRKGAPVIYGGFTSNVDMKSGAPAFGTPEYMKAAIVGGQLARRYHLPYRTSNTCAANTVDAQAAYESVFSLWGVTMGGGNLIMHGAGWLEGGLVASFEKFVLDVDLIQMVMEFLTPVDMSEDALGLDAIREVGPGGHFFGARHTLARYEKAFYAPIISDWRNFQQWQAAGSPDAMVKANAGVEAGARRLPGAAARSCRPRGARCLRGTAQARRRRPHRFLVSPATCAAGGTHAHISYADAAPSNRHPRARASSCEGMTSGLMRAARVTPTDFWFIAFENRSPADPAGFQA